MIKDNKTCEETILDYLKKQKIARSKDILRALRKDNQFGQATIIRHLNSMSKTEVIVKLTYPIYKRYGINLEDKKAKYYISSENAEEKEYYDTIINSLKSKNKSIRDDALIEIESLSGIKLLPEQLTELSNTLIKEDYKTGYAIIRIINSHFEKGIFPSDLIKFQRDLIFCFKKYNNIDEARRDNFTDIILSILGLLGNNAVIDFLEEEIRKTKFIELKIDRYSLWTLSDIITKNRIRLFKLSNELLGKRSKAIFRIRTNAERNLESYSSNIEQYQKKLKGLLK